MFFFQRPRIIDRRYLALDKRLGPLRSKERLSKLIKLLARDPQSRIIGSTVSRSASGKWFISFTVERSAKQHKAANPDQAVGVDLGLTHLATLSTGEKIANSRPLQAALVKLKKAQRQLDRQRRANNPNNYDPQGRALPGGHNWTVSKRMQRSQARIAKLHERVSNLRRQQAHLLTTSLTRQYGLIGVESLNIKGMLANRKLARHISDAGWGIILQQLAYKTNWADSRLYSADRFYPSSKTCSSCRTVKAKLSLAERVFTCSAAQCGLVIDCDLNAAINLAQQTLAAGQAEGLKCHVAPTKEETLNARRGPVRATQSKQIKKPGPMKREESLFNSFQTGDSLAVTTV